VQSLENCLALVSALLVLSIGCIWSGLAMHLVVISVLAGLSSAVSVWFGQVPLALALVGIGALALSFLLVVGVLGALLSGASPAFAIAATVMREAQRQRISVAFIGLMLVVLPILRSRSIRHRRCAIRSRRSSAADVDWSSAWRRS
jgi:hypothetical protein